MSDGHLFDLIRELIEVESKMNERPDSIEFGPANKRCKVYINAQKPDEATVLIDQMRVLADRIPEVVKEAKNP